MLTSAQTTFCGFLNNASKWFFSSRWSKFHVDLNNYKNQLEEALVVHSLIRELEEVRDRANEKVRQLFFLTLMLHF